MSVIHFIQINVPFLDWFGQVWIYTTTLFYYKKGKSAKFQLFIHYYWPTIPAIYPFLLSIATIYPLHFDNYFNFILNHNIWGSGVTACSCWWGVYCTESYIYFPCWNHWLKTVMSYWSHTGVLLSFPSYPYNFAERSHSTWPMPLKEWLILEILSCVPLCRPRRITHSMLFWPCMPETNQGENIT